MVRNKDLEGVVFNALADYLNKRDPKAFELLTEGDKAVAISIIRSKGRTMIDEPYNLKHYFSNLIAHGYDFAVDESRRRYHGAVKSTRRLSGKPFMETFISKGIVDKKFGWYLTELPK